MMMKKLTALFAALSFASAPIYAQDLSHRPQENASSHYDSARDAGADVDAMLAKIAENGKLGIIVFGANWCHDSRDLAEHFNSDRFAEILSLKYEIVYVDVGVPQTGNGRNLDIAKRFGLKKIKGTPTVAILSSSGILLNKKDAPTWRNAYSREENDIFNHFANFSRNISNR